MKNLLILIALLSPVFAFSQGQLQLETSGSLTFTSGRVMQLADAIPSEKYNWSPEEGVRSFAEVFAHIVSANYFFASKLGAQIPAGINMQTIEQDLKTKEEITEALKQSYASIIDAIRNTEDGVLGEKVEFPFPGEFTNMSTILIGLTHSNEHMGQLIAYSRMNGIKPPWSAGQE